MGLNTSSDEWCRRSDTCLECLDLLKLVDDILVQVPTYEEFYMRVKEKLQRCEKHGITLS